MKNKYTLRAIVGSQDYSKINSFFTFKYIFIPLAWPITWLFLKSNMSPNQATFIRLITIIVSYYLVCIGENLIGYIGFLQSLPTQHQ